MSLDTLTRHLLLASCLFCSKTRYEAVSHHAILLPFPALEAASHSLGVFFLFARSLLPLRKSTGAFAGVDLSTASDLTE